MTIASPPDCYKCKHFFFEELGFKCRAFPNKIPTEIIQRLRSHREPYPGDHDIQFEEIDSEEPFDKKPQKSL